MSRRVHACVSCPGRTRHRGPCASCRRRGVRLVGDQLVVSLEMRIPSVRVSLLRSITDVRAPTVAELRAGVDLTRFLTTKAVR